MTTNFYTSVECMGNSILYRGVKNGRRVNLKLKYSPKLFVPSNEQSEWKTLEGNALKAMSFDDIRDARSFVKRYTGVENFKIYGNQSYNYSFIADNFKGMVEWDFDLVNVKILDIEVGSDNGFPEPQKAEQPITAITIMDIKGGSITYGCGSYVSQQDEIYHKCADEYELCKKFIEYWYRNCPDVITGWNTNGFDIPYMYNRFMKILGEEDANKLSPWGIVTERKSFQKNTGKEIITYNIVGVGMLDYLDLYKSFAPNGKSQESYRLDYIAFAEINENKISFDEYDNLHELYKLNHQKFIEYNIKDCGLILKIDDKLKLLELGLTLAYDTKSNYNDIFTQTRMWDALIYNYLLDKNIVIPEKKVSEKEAAYEGAYVKEPLVGMHEWVASFDLNSLHPHLMMQYSLSPENVIDRKYIAERKQNLIMELNSRKHK
jgi:DNA polymerase elongation subunit (family B)